MDSTIHVLCYHRVLEDDGRREHRPYFLRGTAVSLEVFSRHLRDIHDRFECLDEERVLDVLRGKEILTRPGCWITFDDAYVDVLDAAAPLLSEAGMPATVFVPTVIFDGSTLPADKWYATITAARKRRGILREPAGWTFDLDTPNDFHRLIDGLEKRLFLRSSPERQAGLLQQLADTLDAELAEPPHRLYLNPVDLMDLIDRGWSVGSHSVSHAILPCLSEAEQSFELRMSRARITEILGISPMCFSYPDGGWDDAAISRTRESDYLGAVTLEAAVACCGKNMFAIPRFLATNNPSFIRSLPLME